MKNNRHNVIMSIIQNKKIRTHEQLISELKVLGYNVTQATISRDIKVLGLSKFSDSEGSYYAVSSDRSNNAYLHSDYVISVKFGCNMIVIKTKPGTASAVAMTVDSMFEDEILGSIAGDDTIFIAAEDSAKAKELCVALNKFFGKEQL